MTNHSPPRRAALRIAAIYAAVSSLWIFGSDRLLAMLVSETTIEKLTHLQTFKGLVFVSITAVMLFLLVRGATRSYRRAQQALQHSEQSLARAQQVAGLGNWEWNKADDSVYWSEQLYRLFDLPPDGPPLPIQEFANYPVPEDRDKILSALDRCARTGQPFDVDYRIRLPSGTERYLNSQAAATRDASGNIVGMHGTLLDVTARKRAEEQLRQLNDTLEKRVALRTLELQQANEDLRTFSYTISHDLSTPLRNVRRLAGRVLESNGGRADTATQDYARRIIASAARLERLIHDLFEYSQLARSDIQPQQISMVLVVHDVIGQLRREPEFAAARFDVHEPMQWILAHRPTLSLVLQNLLSNAVKHVPQGTQPVVTVSSEDRGKTARLTIEDNGTGLDPARSKSIFYVFEQPHEIRPNGSGSGIGLAIVRRGVARMGGSVGVDSTPGAGSRFWIELPKDPQSP